MARLVHCCYCGAVVELGDEVTAALAPCPACGCMNDVGIEEPTDAVPMALPVDEDEPPEEFLASRERKQHLVSPWPVVLRGLAVAWWATLLSILVQVVWIVGIGLIATTAQPKPFASTLGLAITFAQLVTGILHLCGQGWAA